MRTRHLPWPLVGLTLVLTSAFAAPGPAGAEDPDPRSLEVVSDGISMTGRVDGDKASTSGLAESDQGLLRRTDSRPVRVMIKLDYDSTATYQGGVDGLAATSPSVTGRPLTGRTPRERDYEAYVRGQEGSVKAKIREVAPEVSFGQAFRRVYGGVSAVLPANRAKDVAAINRVVAVQRNTMNQPLTDSSTDFVNAPPAYDELGGPADAGEGVIYGNFDTGIWPEHPSFADQGNLGAPPGPARECNYGDNPLTPATDVFECQNKLIGGVWSTQFYDSIPELTPDAYAGTARDGHGHGTHTASISAGNVVDSVEVFGAERGPIQGLAPGAWVIEYKVCGPDGCFQSDSVAAVEQAIADDVDVINFSITGGSEPFNDPVELAFLDAYAAGVFVSTSAGNTGPGAGTVNHRSPWTTSVAASTQEREFVSTLSLTASNGDVLTADGASITAAAGPAPVVLAEDVPGYTGDARCGDLADPDDFEGIIVACRIGGQYPFWKSYVASQGGAAGMVLYYPAALRAAPDNHWVPTVHLADGTDFVGFMNAHADVTGSFTAGAPQPAQGDVMAAFSARGPGGSFIKPDLTAPGVQILAGASPTPEEPGTATWGTPPGQLYQAIAGTSMASPHVAGAALLVRAVHPGWTPGQIRSALMTTAVTEVVKEDGTTPADPFDRGAGRIDVGASIEVPLLFDETAANFAALGNDPVHAVHLNLPSINAPVMPGRLVTTRTATNATGKLLRVDTSSQAGPGSTITVSPRRFLLRPGKSRQITITIDSQAPIGEQQFGTVHLDTHGASMHLPVAFIHTRGDVSLVQSCDPTIIKPTKATDCVVEAANSSYEEQTVELTSTVPSQFMVTAVDGAKRVGLRSVRTTATLAGLTPGVPSVAPSGFGYRDLETLGIAPIPIGDEVILNFNTLPYEYAGQSWNRLAVDSNGYLVVGGGTFRDNECCTLPAGPDPARPNNILAPFWTDLDGTGAPGIRIARLTDGAESWYVVQYNVNVWGTTDQRAFQVWIGLNGVEDITYEYAAGQSDPNGQDYLVGGENVNGEGQMERLLPTTTGLRVTSHDAAPGDVVSYTFRARGTRIGTGDLVTEMEASRVPGVTIARIPLQVVR